MFIFYSSVLEEGRSKVCRFLPEFLFSLLSVLGFASMVVAPYGALLKFC